jgi:hypothetical protein
MRHVLVCLSAFLLAAPEPGAAPPASGRTAVPVPEIPATVTRVVSGSYWEAGSTRGTYRIVVACAGWEHVGCSVQVQWIGEMAKTSSLEIVKSLPLEGEPDGWSIGAPRLNFQRALRKTVLKLSATNPHTLKEASFEFELGVPGEWRRLERAQAE